jgi:beta-lactam-binding protein with PASTA domain
MNLWLLQYVPSLVLPGRKGFLMRGRRSAGRLIRVLAAPLLGAGVLAGFATTPASAEVCEAWSGQQPPPIAGAADTRLRGVAAVSPCDIWAIGNDEDNISPGNEGLIEHWTGGESWTIAATLNLNSYSTLSGISAVSANDVWVVGHTSDEGSELLRTLILHWDGSSWSQVSSPNPGPQKSLLSGVTATSASDAWAVGSYQTDTGLKTLTAHWDGSSWRQVASPSPGTASNSLASVTATSATNAWAVGVSGSGTVNQTLIERWDGSAWTTAGSASPGTYRNTLTSVSATSATDAWAVGSYSDDPLSPKTLVEHWDGSSWTRKPSADPDPQGNELLGVTATSATDAWAVGRTAPSNGLTHALIEHWDGSAWQPVTSSQPGQTNYLLAVGAATTGFVWAVGGFDGQALVTRLQGRPSVQVAVQGPDGQLYESGAAEGDVGGPLVAPGTSPALAMKPGGGSELIWQIAGTHQLDILGIARELPSTPMFVAADSSPAIAALADPGFVIVFKNAADQNLWRRVAGGEPVMVGSGLPVAAGTSPVVAASPFGGFEIAFQAAGTGDLWTVTPDGVAHDSLTKLAAGTGPGIAALPGGGYEVVYAGADGVLWQVGPDGIPRVAANGPIVAGGTSPVVAASPSGFEIAFRDAGSHDLWTISPGGTAHDTGLAMAASSSPAIAALLVGGFEIEFQSASGDLTTLTRGGVPVNTSVAMAAGTSQTIGGRGLVLVPLVAGSAESTAISTLQSAGLASGQTTFTSSCAMSSNGLVMSTAPSGCTSVLGGTQVDLTECHITTVTVPVVTGITPGDASARLAANGLTAGGQSSTASCPGPSNGLVVASNPAAGQVVPQGTAVSLVVCAPYVTVPRVMYYDDASAENVITGAGLTVSVSYVNNCSAEFGTVIMQNPSGGTLVLPGTTVSLQETSGMAPGGGICIIE